MHDLHFDLCYGGHAVPSALSEAFKLASYCQLFRCLYCFILPYSAINRNANNATETVQYSNMPMPSLSVHAVMYSEVCRLYIKCMNEFDIGCGISPYGRDHL